jgi:hypothetical protein
MPSIPGATMSRWEEEKAERSQRSLARLCDRFVWGAHLLRVIAWRVRLLAAAKRPAAGTGGSATTARSGCHPHSGRRPRLIENAPTRWARAFAVCAGNRFIASAGMSIYGTRGPTRMRSGTAHAWPHGNSGMRRVITQRLLRHLQARRCNESGGRLWKSAQVDHPVPLFRVWSEHRDAPSPKLVGYWGLPNLQVINRDVHAEKCATEAQDRRAARYLASEHP